MKAYGYSEAWARMFIATLFVRVQSQKYPRCPAMGRGLNMLHGHPIDYFSTIKREKILTHKTTWMNRLSLETSTAWERKSQLICLWFHWHDTFFDDNSLQTETMSVCHGLRRRVGVKGGEWMQLQNGNMRDPSGDGDVSSLVPSMSASCCDAVLWFCKMVYLGPGGLSKGYSRYRCRIPHRSLCLNLQWSHVNNCN